MPAISREEERQRLTRAHDLTREAMKLTDGFAPTAYDYLQLAAVVLGAVTHEPKAAE